MIHKTYSSDPSPEINLSSSSEMSPITLNSKFGLETFRFRNLDEKKRFLLDPQLGNWVKNMKTQLRCLMQGTGHFLY